MEILNQQTIGGFNRKEAGSFDMVYEHFYSRVIEQIRKKTNFHPDAAILANDVFMKLCKVSRKFAAHYELEETIKLITHNHCVDFIRKETLKKEKETAFYHNAEEIFEPDYFKSEIFQKMLELIRDATQPLPEASRKVFMESLRHPGTPAELAAQLNMPLKTVKNHLWKARKFYRPIFKEKFKNEEFVLFILTLIDLYAK